MMKNSKLKFSELMKNISSISKRFGKFVLIVNKHKIIVFWSQKEISSNEDSVYQTSL